MLANAFLLPRSMLIAVLAQHCCCRVCTIMTAMLQPTSHFESCKLPGSCGTPGSMVPAAWERMGAHVHVCSCDVALPCREHSARGMEDGACILPQLPCIAEHG